MRCSGWSADAVRASLVHYENHADRMDYPRYRQAGLPLTSSLMESTVEQVSRRVKGTEKFWSSAGGETMLRLRAESLSDTQPLRRHLQRRAQHATGTRSHRLQSAYPWPDKPPGALGLFTVTRSVSEVIEMYSPRWRIESFFKELKSTLGFAQYSFEKFLAVEAWVECEIMTVRSWNTNEPSD